MITVTPLAQADRARWDVLARGYKTFYATVLTDADYDATWERLLRGSGVYGLGAHLEGHLVGIAHYMFHTSAWSADACYLQDLFVDAAVRGQGVGRALIEQVAQAAQAHGAPRLYWLTHQDNATARTLYDKVAHYRGFIRYDYAFPAAGCLLGAASRC
ncbi:MAG: GNAT family N-acetyltransferase [Caldilineaceae bacterium]